MEHRALSDTELLLLLKGNDSEISKAYKYLYATTKGYLTLLIRKDKGHTSDHDDVFIEAFLETRKNVLRDTFMGRSSLTTYLLSIATRYWNRTVSKRKRSPIHVHISQFTQQLASSETDTDSDELVAQMIASLSEKHQSVIYRYYFLGHSHQQIANSLGYANADTVKAIKYRIINQLIQLYRTA